MWAEKPIDKAHRWRLVLYFLENEQMRADGTRNPGSR